MKNLYINKELYSELSNKVDILMQMNIDSDFEYEISKIMELIQPEYIRDSLRNLNSMFLNIILNRLQEFDKYAEEKAYKCRKIIYNKIMNYLNQ
jgi:hypothetical protein